MNEFEKLLGAAQPAQGRSDPMQIMFLAGQESVVAQPKNGAGGWQIATGLLAAACVVLTTCLLLPRNTPVSDSIARSPDETSLGTADISTPNEQPSLTFAATPEVSVDNPESWKHLGVRSRQLESITGQSVHPVQNLGSEPLTPFTFQREAIDNFF